MYAAANDGGGNTRRQVAVADQANASARGANLVDQLRVPRPIEHDDDEIFDPAAVCLRNRPKIEANRRVEVDHVASARADDELLHVNVRRMEQAATFGRGQDSQRIRRSGGAQIRALERIDGDVDWRIRARRAVSHPDLLANVEHRRLVALAFTNDDGAVDRNRVHFPPHGFHGDLIRLVPVPLTHRVRTRYRRLFDDTEKVERQVRVREG